MLVCRQGECGPFVPWSIKVHSWPSFWFGIRELGWIVFLVIHSCDSFRHNGQQKNASWFSCRDSLLYWTNTDGWTAWTGSYCYTVGRLSCICCPLGPVTPLIVQKKVHLFIHCLCIVVHWCANICTCCYKIRRQFILCKFRCNTSYLTVLLVFKDTVCE